MLKPSGASSGDVAGIGLGWGRSVRLTQPVAILARAAPSTSQGCPLPAALLRVRRLPRPVRRATGAPSLLRGRHIHVLTITNHPKATAAHQGGTSIGPPSHARCSPLPLAGQPTVKTEVMQLDSCPRCGRAVDWAGRGRRPLWCSQACRRAAYEKRRASASEGIAVRVVQREKVIERV